MWQFLSHNFEIKNNLSNCCYPQFFRHKQPQKVEKHQHDATLWTDDEYKRLKIQVLQAELRY